MNYFLAKSVAFCRYTMKVQIVALNFHRADREKRWINADHDACGHNRFQLAEAQVDVVQQRQGFKCGYQTLRVCGQHAAVSQLQPAQLAHA